MSWSKLHGGAHRHRKVLQLESRLGCSELEARGIVLTVWSWTIESEPDGDLDGWTAEALARVWGWRGDASVLIGALVGVGLLDEENGALRVHDWMEHAEGWKDADRKRKERQRKRRAPRPENVQDTSGTVQGLSGKRPPERRGEERRGEEKRGEEKKNLGGAEDGPAEALSLHVILSLPLIGGKTHGVTQEDVDRWAVAFPAVDIPGELAKIASWLDANATKRPRSSVKAFVHRWLTKSQNDAASISARHAADFADRPKYETTAQYAARRAREEMEKDRAAAQHPAQGSLRIAAHSGKESA